MIISLILGGLGNQCFQYALGRQLAHAQQAPLKLETRGYRLPKYARHPYLLDRFNIRAERAGPRDYLRIAPQLFRRSTVQFERAGEFDPGVLALRQSMLLIGYWQSERYFRDVAASLRAELTLREPPAAATREMSERIAASESVAVHVRRTDYVENPKNAALYEQCSLDYYRDAMLLIAQRVRSPHFFVFSDDPGWTRTHLRSDHPLTYVDHNDASRAHEDLMLMRQCRHDIIANSTLSWWGAWLNDYAGKIVVSPRRWFKGGGGRREEALLPETWIRI